MAFIRFRNGKNIGRNANSLNYNDMSCIRKNSGFISGWPSIEMVETSLLLSALRSLVFALGWLEVLPALYLSRHAPATLSQPEFGAQLTSVLARTNRLLKNAKPRFFRRRYYVLGALLFLFL